MPVAFPPGTLLTPVTPESTLTTERVADFHYELLDKDDQLLGPLTGVGTGGELMWDAYAGVKSVGNLPITDLDQGINWLNARIRITAHLDPPDIEVPLGIYLCAAPVEEWTRFGRSWKVELMDKSSVLDQDIQTDSDGNPITYGVDVGVNVIDKVKELILAAGESVDAIEPGNETMGAAQVWEPGTSTLKIINDLLTQAGYFSLYCDGSGQFRATPYVPPAQRIPIYSEANPFEIGDKSLMSPDWTNDQDLYSIPNRYVVIGQGNGEAEALTAVATNTNELSPFSYQARGRWITAVEQGVEATGQEALDTYAARQLGARSSAGRSVKIKHLFLPEAQINRVVRFIAPEANIDTLFSILSMRVTLDPLALTSTSIQEVLTA
jgi:hypothetical protein